MCTEGHHSVADCPHLQDARAQIGAAAVELNRRHEIMEMAPLGARLRILLYEACTLRLQLSQFIHHLQHTVQTYPDNNTSNFVHAADGTAAKEVG